MLDRLSRSFVRLGSPAIAVLALLVTGLPAAPAAGQFGGRGDFQGLSQLMQPEYNSRDVALIVNTLKLDESQRDVVAAFLSDYETKFREESDRFNQAREQLTREMRENRNSGIDWRERIRPIREQTEAFQKFRQKAGETFLSDVRTVLLPEQEQLWPEFERVLRRKNSLPLGLISGENVDLFRITEETVTDPAEKERIKDSLLTGYGEQLDLALQRRDDDMQRAQEDFTEAFQSFDIELARKAMERQRAMRVRIRDLNESFAQQIAQALSDPTPFITAYKRAAFPTVYRESWGQLTFASAFDLPNLDASTENAIRALKEQFEQRLDAANRSLESVLRIEEPAQGERILKALESRQFGQNMMNDDPIRKAFDDRTEMENSFVTQLHSFLTEEQTKALPARPDRPRTGGAPQGFDGGGRRGGSGGGRGPGDSGGGENGRGG